MKILYVGPLQLGSNARCWRDALIRLGHEVKHVDSDNYFPNPQSFLGKVRAKLYGAPVVQMEVFQEAIIRKARITIPELALFCPGRNVRKETLELLSKICPTAAYMNDDMFNTSNRWKGFDEAVRLLSVIVTTKSFNVKEFQSIGARQVFYLPNAYDPTIHRAARLSKADRNRYGGEVAFVGTFRRERADELARLLCLRPQTDLRVWGGGWEKMERFDNYLRHHRWESLCKCVKGGELWGVNMSKALGGASICLGLLNHANRDQHTSRTFEIPASGGFMLAERTPEHLEMFREGEEAEYFSSTEEMVEKVSFYVSHPQIRKRIARAGHRICLQGKNTYVDRARSMLQFFRPLRMDWRHGVGRSGN